MYLLSPKFKVVCWWRLRFLPDHGSSLQPELCSSSRAGVFFRSRRILHIKLLISEIEGNGTQVHVHVEHVTSDADPVLARIS